MNRFWNKVQWELFNYSDQTLGEERKIYIIENMGEDRLFYECMSETMRKDISYKVLSYTNPDILEQHNQKTYLTVALYSIANQINSFCMYLKQTDGEDFLAMYHDWLAMVTDSTEVEGLGGIIDGSVSHILTDPDLLELVLGPNLSSAVIHYEVMRSLEPNDTNVNAIGLLYEMCLIGQFYIASIYRRTFEEQWKEELLSNPWGIDPSDDDGVAEHVWTLNRNALFELKEGVQQAIDSQKETFPRTFLSDATVWDIPANGEYVSSLYIWEVVIPIDESLFIRDASTPIGKIVKATPKHYFYVTNDPQAMFDIPSDHTIGKLHNIISDKGDLL